MHHRGKALHAFCNRAVDVFAAESFTGGTKDHDLVGPGLERRLKTDLVGREHRVTHTRLALDAGHHFGVVGHLRHPLGRHKTGDLDLGQAGGLKTVHQLDFDGSWHRGFFILQPVSGADVDELDTLRYLHSLEYP